jgi:voltage-gated potassium channel
MIALSLSLFFSTFRQFWANIFVGFFFLLSLIVAAFSISKSRFQFLIMLGISGATVLPVWHFAIPDRIISETLNNALWLILIFYIGLIIFQDIIKSKLISSNEIYGAISVYLLTGTFFGIIFQTVLLFDPNALYFNPINFKDLPPTDGEIFYYSFITLSTVGYGDVSPVAPIARSISMIEAILGVMYVATMIARFVANHKNKDERV